MSHVSNGLTSELRLILALSDALREHPRHDIREAFGGDAGVRGWPDLIQQTAALLIHMAWPEFVETWIRGVEARRRPDEARVIGTALRMLFAELPRDKIRSAVAAVAEPELHDAIWQLTEPSAERV
jgi:hypothetical protein